MNRISIRGVLFYFFNNAYITISYLTINAQASYTWVSQKATGICFISLCWLYYFVISCRNLRPSGLSAFKITVIMCKNNATIEIKIFYWFKTKYSAYFVLSIRQIYGVAKYRDHMLKCVVRVANTAI